MKLGILLAIGGIALIFACLALIAITGTVAQDIAQRNAAEVSTPDTQRVTAICAGINIGSCNTKQTTGMENKDSNPWLFILFGVALLCPLVFGVALRRLGAI